MDRDQAGTADQTTRSPCETQRNRSLCAKDILTVNWTPPPLLITTPSVDLPDGQITAYLRSLSSRPAKNISLHRLVETAIEQIRPVPDQRGVSRTSQTLGTGCDGRGCFALTNEACCGRQSRVVLTPRRWRSSL